MDNEIIGDYMKIIRVVAAIIIDEDKVLATQRGCGSGTYWKNRKLFEERLICLKL